MKTISWIFFVLGLPFRLGVALAASFFIFILLCLDYSNKDMARNLLQFWRFALIKGEPMP